MHGISNGDTKFVFGANGLLVSEPNPNVAVVLLTLLSSGQVFNF